MQLLLLILLLLVLLVQCEQFKKVCLNNHLAPSLFILGPQKTGTTSLAADVRRVFPRLITTGTPTQGDPSFFWKEKHYFGGDYVDYYGDLQRYLGHYPKCDQDYRVGADCTPMLSSAKAPLRIANTYRDLSSRLHFVATLRNPVMRLISEYRFMSTHFVKSRRFVLWIDFDKYVDQHPESKSWESWKFHFQTRKKHLSESLTSTEADSLFVPWINSQLALAWSCMNRDGISKSDLWPKCGTRGLFRGMYSSQLQYWWNNNTFLSRDQFIVFPMKYYIENPNIVLRRLGQRLNICSFSFKQIDAFSLSPSRLPFFCEDRVHISNATHANADNHHDIKIFLRDDAVMLNSLKVFYKSFNEALLMMIGEDDDDDDDDSHVFWGEVGVGGSYDWLFD